MRFLACTAKNKDYYFDYHYKCNWEDEELAYIEQNSEDDAQGSDGIFQREKCLQSCLDILCFRHQIDIPDQPSCVV